jgi:protein SCO1/2
VRRIRCLPSAGWNVAAVVAVLALILTGCAAKSQNTGMEVVGGQQSGPFHGTDLDPAPQSKPAFTLTDTSGQAYNFANQTAGKITLLYFGYTHCPDVCPLIMAYLAQALKTLPPKVSSQVDVVFVTVDPARDTPQVLHSWLTGIDPSYVGLTGSVQQIIAAEKASGVPSTRVETSAPNGYTIQHSAEVLAFSRDDKAHVVFDSSTLPADYEHDLKLLVKGIV